MYVAGLVHSIQKGYLFNNKHPISLDLPSTDKLLRNKRCHSVCFKIVFLIEPLKKDAVRKAQVYQELVKQREQQEDAENQPAFDFSVR